MEKTRILVIAPYEGLREIITEEAKQLSEEIEVSVYVGDLSDGLNIARSQVEKGFDVILSRGGTAELIKRSLPLPVVDIVPTVLDVLRLVRLARNMPYRRAIVAFPAITSIAAKLFDLVEQSEEIYTIHDASEAQTVIAQLKAEGFELILGDVITVATAQKMKLNAILIASGSESVHAAFTESIRLQKVINNLMERNLFFQDILAWSSLNVVVFNQDKNMIYSNLSSDQMEYPRVFRAINECVPTVFSKGELSISRKSKGFVWNIKGQRITQKMGDLAVFYVDKKQFLPRSKTNIIEYYHMLSDNDVTQNNLIDTLGVMKNIQESAEQLGKTLIPVLVSGEAGTPTASIINTLYLSSPWNMHTMVSIDCILMEENSFRWLLESEDSPLCENRLNIFFKNIDRLADNLIRLYMNFAKNTELHKRNRILYSTRSDIASDFLTFLNEMSCAMLHIPSLFERRQDIPGLANLYLSTLNIEMGRQALGFSSEALLQMQEYKWPGNHDQLRRVLRQSLISTKNDIISWEDLTTALSSEKAITISVNGCLSLDGTLAEINARAVREVLIQEGMNRSRTVDRLGISRSTLWRMLK